MGKRAKMDDLFGVGAAFQTVENKPQDVIEIKMPVAAVVGEKLIDAVNVAEKEAEGIARAISAAVTVEDKKQEHVQLTGQIAAAAELQKQERPRAAAKIVQSSVSEKSEKAKVTFTPDATLWEDVLLLIKAKGLSQIDFLTNVLTQAVSMDRAKIEIAKKIEAQYRSLRR